MTLLICLLKHNTTKCMYGPQSPSEDSDQPAHSRSLIRISPWHILDSQGCSLFMRTTKTDQTGVRCAGQFGSPLGARQVRLRTIVSEF